MPPKKKSGLQGQERKRSARLSNKVYKYHEHGVVRVEQGGDDRNQGPGLEEMCHDCGGYFSSTYALERHKAKAVCYKFFCKTDHQHNRMEKDFNSVDEAREWIKDLHLDKDFMISSSKKSGLIVYSCIQGKKWPKEKDGDGKWQRCLKRKKNEDEISANDKSTASSFCAAKILVKPRKTTDIQHGCPAIALTACLAHNHEIMPVKQRIPARVKEVVIRMIKDGVTFDEILMHKFDSPKIANYETTRVFLHRSTIKNIAYREFPKEFKQELQAKNKAKQRQELLPQQIVKVEMNLPEGIFDQFLLWDEIIGFSMPQYPFDSQSLTDELKDKLLFTTNQDSTAVMFMSKEQRERFAKYPHTLVLDVTALQEKSSSCQFQIVSGLVVDSRAECSPVFQVILEQATPNAEIFSAALTRLKASNEEAASKIRYICCRLLEPQLANTIHADSRAVFGSHVQPLYTVKQLNTALKQDFKNADILAAIDALRLEADPEQFQHALNQFECVHGGTDEGRKFLTEYGNYGNVIPLAYWAVSQGAVMLPNNIGIKYYKTEILRVLKQEPRSIQGSLLQGLKECDARYARNEELKALDMGGVNKRIRSFRYAFQQCHVNPADYQLTINERGHIDLIKVSQQEPNVVVESAVIRIQPDNVTVCNPKLCQTRCKECTQGGMCAHAFQCTCNKFVDERYCPHLHVAISMVQVEGSEGDPLLLHKKLLGDSRQNDVTYGVQTVEGNKAYEDKKAEAVLAAKKLLNAVQGRRTKRTMEWFDQVIAFTRSVTAQTSQAD